MECSREYSVVWRWQNAFAGCVSCVLWSRVIRTRFTSVRHHSPPPGRCASLYFCVQRVRVSTGPVSVVMFRKMKWKFKPLSDDLKSHGQGIFRFRVWSSCSVG